MKSYAFLFWAYNAIWLGIVGYVVFIVLRLRKLDRKIDRISASLDTSDRDQRAKR